VLPIQSRCPFRVGCRVRHRSEYPSRSTRMSLGSHRRNRVLHASTYVRTDYIKLACARTGMRSVVWAVQDGSRNVSGSRPRANRAGPNEGIPQVTKDLTGFE
jgi:hypothetical protein